MSTRRTSNRSGALIGLLVLVAGLTACSGSGPRATPNLLEEGECVRVFEGEGGRISEVACKPNEFATYRYLGSESSMGNCPPNTTDWFGQKSGLGGVACLRLLYRD